MRKKFFSRGIFGLALLMLFGLTLPTWGQGTSTLYTVTNTKMKTATDFVTGTLITLKATWGWHAQHFMKGDAPNCPNFEAEATTFRVERKEDGSQKFALKRMDTNEYIAKPTGFQPNKEILVSMTTVSEQIAWFEVNPIGGDKLRFTETSVHANCHFNTNDPNKVARWFSGTGGYSHFYAYKVTTSEYNWPTFEENKPFRVISKRGTLTYDTERGKLHFVTGMGDDSNANQKFAIITNAGKMYLYNYGVKKFVASDYYRDGSRMTTLPFYTVNKINATSPTDNYAYKFELTGGGYSNFINISTNAVKIDHWTTEDDGNRFYLKNIEETVDQATILKDAYNAAITAAKAQNYTDGISTIENGTDLATAKNNWNTLKTNARLKSGFYRFKGVSGNYITAGDKASNLVRNNTQSNADNIFYCETSGTTEKLVALKNGYGLSAENVQQLGELNTADGLTLRLTDEIKYSLKGSTEYFYDSSTGFTKGATEHENAGLIAESITQIPVTLHNGEATFYTPVAVSVSEGTTAYKGSVSGSTLTLTALNGTIPANTPFFLKGEGANCTLTVTTRGATISDNAFTGSVKTRAQATGKSTYVLSDAEFKLLGEGVNCRGFRAQVETETNSGVQGFTLEFDNITAIESVETPTDNTPVFDLSGRRVAKTVKGGIYLRNGKKFVQ